MNTRRKGTENMAKIIKARIEEMAAQHKNEHAPYEYVKKVFVPRREGGQCTVSVYSIPPQKCAYPYHYHTKNEEVFFILQGVGVLRTPEGEQAVTAGDFLFFPAEESGAHKLTNPSLTEPLVYIDFDTSNDLDVAYYPDSGKVGIWGKGINKLYKEADEVPYYEGE